MGGVRAKGGDGKGREGKGREKKTAAPSSCTCARQQLPRPAHVQDSSNRRALIGKNGRVMPGPPYPLISSSLEVGGGGGWGRGETLKCHVINFANSTQVCSKYQNRRA